MATLECFDKTIAILENAKVGMELLNVQVGICLGEPRYQRWTTELEGALLIVKSKSWIIGKDGDTAFAMVGSVDGNPEVNYQGHAATPILALVIAALKSRKDELLAEPH